MKIMKIRAFVSIIFFAALAASAARAADGIRLDFTDGGGYCRRPASFLPCRSFFADIRAVSVYAVRIL